MAEKKTANSTTTATPGGRPVRWVSFVGAGPGDPELLTVRALELIKDADVVVTEHAAHEALVRAVRGLGDPVVNEETGEITEVEGAPIFLDGGFGDDEQPLTAAARGKVVVKAAKSGNRVVRCPRASVSPSTGNGV